MFQFGFVIFDMCFLYAFWSVVLSVLSFVWFACLFLCIFICVVFLKFVCLSEFVCVCVFVLITCFFFSHCLCMFSVLWCLLFVVLSSRTLCFECGLICLYEIVCCLLFVFVFFVFGIVRGCLCFVSHCVYVYCCVC